MASIEVIVWECDRCHFEAKAPSKKRMPKWWLAIHIISEGKMLASLDLCPTCSQATIATVNEGKVQNNG